uniref:Uncharacterized protein n=1 Tax=Lepeophtheirus salmonis TaxID=72036 RepID=A0A0K2UWZ1_LEPSM
MDKTGLIRTNATLYTMENLELFQKV